MASVIVLYPQGAKFDMDYYLATHMPLVQKHWAPEGLKSWKALELDTSAPYCAGATLEFDNLGDFKKASGGDAAKIVLGDIPNFCDKQPIMLPATIKHAS